jgi:hypothetical protein
MKGITIAANMGIYVYYLLRLTRKKKTHPSRISGHADDAAPEAEPASSLWPNPIAEPENDPAVLDPGAAPVVVS